MYNWFISMLSRADSFLLEQEAITGVLSICSSRNVVLRADFQEIDVFVLDKWYNATVLWFSQNNNRKGE